MMLGVNVMFIWFSTLTKLIQVQHELVWMEFGTSTKCIHHFIIYLSFYDIFSPLYSNWHCFINGCVYIVPNLVEC